MADFSKKQGGIQSSNSTGRDPKDQGGAPKSGISEAPTSGGLADTGAGPGVGNSRGSIR